MNKILKTMEYLKINTYIHTTIECQLIININGLCFRKSYGKEYPIPMDQLIDCYGNGISEALKIQVENKIKNNIVGFELFD